jgi:dTMP kinase
MRFIVIDGLDGCGKSTQVDLLREYLVARGQRVLLLDYPCYGTKGCTLVEMYLNKEICKDTKDSNPYAASLFYAVDRYVDSCTGTLSKLKSGNYDIVLANRYTTSNAIYQCASLPKSEWSSYCDWLFNLEYNLLKLPAPDDVLFLTLPVEVSQRLLSERYDGDETKKDLYESDVSFLHKTLPVTEYLALKYDWFRLDCSRNNNIMSVDEIHRRIKEVLNI